jgi:hypothetical protein
VVSVRLTGPIHPPNATYKDDADHAQQDESKHRVIDHPLVLVYTGRERLAAPWKYLGFRRVASLISVKVGLLSKDTGPELVSISIRVIVT